MTQPAKETAEHAATVKEILGLLEEVAPLDFAEEWDNCGLLVGDPGAGVKRILVALEPTMRVLGEAAEREASLVVTHHPLFIRPISQVRADTAAGRAIHFLIREGISLIALHTNFDLATGGVADLLMARLGFKEHEILAPDPRGLVHRGSAVGMGRTAKIRPRVTLSELVSRVFRALSISGARVAGAKDMTVGKVAVVPGSGADFIGLAKEAGCDAIITGDVKHHQARDAEELGLAVLDIGHFTSEAVALEGLCRSIRRVA